MKKGLLLFSLLVGLLSAHAQPSLQITAGIQHASVTPHFLVYPDTVSKTATQKIGVALGLVANVEITSRLFFHTGVVYSTKGSDWTQFYDTTNLYYKTVNLSGEKKIKKYSVNTQLNLQYIEIPLDLLYQLPFKKNASFIVGLGPQASVFYNGNIRTQTLSVSQDSLGAGHVRTYLKETENNDLLVGKGEARFRVLHFALNAFAGIEFKRVFLRVNYDQDLTDFYAEEGRRYKNKTIGLRFGIYLGQRTGKDGRLNR